jgi:RecJ-like exonuclease
MQTSNEPQNPGDEAPPDAPGGGESPCRVCRGTGVVEGRQCTVCGGTGKLLQGIGRGR